MSFLRSSLFFYPWPLESLFPWQKNSSKLEYIVVHEMAHLIESTHNARFVALMDRYLPDWRLLRDELNRFPLAHVNWEY